MIDRRYFERWADTVPAKAGMAELVTKLVMNTLPNDGSSYNIPIGSSTFCEGWDGYVESMERQQFIPEGKSGWEFGAVSNFIKKANSDYGTRTEGIPDDEKKQTTFVFVTPYYWKKKGEWVAKKMAEKKWKNIIVYDSDSLSQWIYRLPIVTEWFADKINLTINSGIVLPKVVWDEISIGPNRIVLSPRFYLAGRERIVEVVKNMIEGKPGLKAFRASSREEAKAFILAAGQSLPEPTRSLFMGKTVIVDSKESLRSMSVSMESINIVAHLEDNSTVYAAAAKNIVLVALGPNDEFRQDVVDLPVPERHALVEELVSYGIAEPEANKIVFTNSCNLTLIRKELGFPLVGVKWMGKEELDNLKPALLLGRWNENYETDENILCAIAGIECNKYQVFLDRWLKQSVSPLTKTGPIWRLTSPLTLWTVLSSQLDETFFETLQKVFSEVFINKKQKYSSHLKEGLLQTLIIIALYGDRLRLPIGNAQEWVDSNIKNLLHGASPEKWVEISDNLPLLAEASPNVFISELKIAIKEQEPIITALFKEKNGFIYPQSHHTWLLWALEALAWHPCYLEDVTKILLKLTEMDPGGLLSNRPFNSLVDIYMPWKPHTSVNMQNRLGILDKCLKDGYSIMWKLLLAMLPHPGAVTSETFKLKWRDYELEEQGYDLKIVYNTTEWVVSRLISYFDGNDQHLASLIEAIEPVDISLRNQFIKWLPEAVKLISGSCKETRKALRETLWYQNLTGIEERYTFTDEEEKSIRAVYDSLIPIDLKERYTWLFDEYYPHLPYKTNEKEDIYVNGRQTERLRKEACSEMIGHLGIDEVISLKDVVKEPQTLGSTLAFFSNDELTTKICSLLGTDENVKFTNGYFASLERQQGENVISSLYDVCKNVCLTKEGLIALLLCFEQNKKLWDFIESLDHDIQNSYWERIPAVFWGKYEEDVTLYKMRKMIVVGRGLDAMNNLWIYAKEMPTLAILELLQNILKSNLKLNESIKHQPLSVFVEQLHKRVDTDRDLLLQLEWAYLPVLRYDHRNNSLGLLNDRLSNDPDFVIELLSYIYNSNNDETQEKEPSYTERQNAQRAFYLLNQWKKIPCVDNNNFINGEALYEWVKAVLKKSSECGQYKHACSQLGLLFSNYPEWNDEATKLFSIVEPIEEKAFYSNYYVGLFNKRGFTSRGPYEGGEIERRNASKFKVLYEKYYKRFPRISKVFIDLSEEYERIAKKMDDNAEITKLDY